MDIKHLEEKLAGLREELARLETEGLEEIRLKRILADMGDDLRENEGAKLVMEQNVMLYIRISQLKKEIYELKKKIWAIKHDTIRN